MGGLFTILGRRDAFGIIGSIPLSGATTLPAGSSFSLRVDEGSWRSVTITQASSANNLVANINTALVAPAWERKS